MFRVQGLGLVFSKDLFSSRVLGLGFAVTSLFLTLVT